MERRRRGSTQGGQHRSRAVALGTGCGWRKRRRGDRQGRCLARKTIGRACNDCRRARCSCAATASAFPPGGCAYLHRHQGPGIRCLLEGGIRIDTHGRSTSYGPGRRLVRNRPGCGVRASRRPADAVHPRNDPAGVLRRQKLGRVSQRGRQGQAEVATVQDFRRHAADIGGERTGTSSMMWAGKSLTLGTQASGSRYRGKCFVSSDPTQPARHPVSRGRSTT